MSILLIMGIICIIVGVGLGVMAFLPEWHPFEKHAPEDTGAADEEETDGISEK